MSWEHSHIAARERFFQPQLAQSFPNDPLGDVRVRYNSLSFKLQRQRLTESSGYFRAKLRGAPEEVTDVLIEDAEFAPQSRGSEHGLLLVMKWFYSRRLLVMEANYVEVFRWAQNLRVEDLTASVREFVQRNQDVVPEAVAQEVLQPSQ